MDAAHGTPPRGLVEVSKSPLFAGKFGRMFRSLPRATYGKDVHASLQHLERLADGMVSRFDHPKDGADDEESGIPALYTYFGQFIDHDLTFDPASTLQAQNDPSALVDYRTPAFDLDNLYGRGPSDQPYLYDQTSKTFLLGARIEGGKTFAYDLPRNTGKPARALIGDPRNDENSILSQFGGLMLRFHNQLVATHENASFAEIQRLVRFHYQYVILNDFLPRIIRKDILDALAVAPQADAQPRVFDRSKLRFFHWKNAPFMPVEFSVAAYRFGHSMIRPGYRLNDDILLPIFPVERVKPPLPEGLTGFKAMPATHAIDWGRFIDIDKREYGGEPSANHPPTPAQKRRLQFAYRIDTSLVDPLRSLPLPIATPPKSLALRNLERGFRMELPSGQAVARAMGLVPLDDTRIRIGQGTDDPHPAPIPIRSISRAFDDNCPLWTYILAEAMNDQIDVTVPVSEKVSITTPQLGDVGGRIVAEVFLGLMFGDANSMLSSAPHWRPEKTDYRLKDLVDEALSWNLSRRDHAANT